MSRQNLAYFAFNRGLVSPLALARADIKRLALSAETQTNWMSRQLGAMSLRPGLGYIAGTMSNNAARCIPFIFSTSDVARVEFTDSVMRVFVNDAVITRTAVSTAVTNGDFSSSAGLTSATFTVATPCVVTYGGADVFANGDPVMFTASGGLPAPLNNSTVYYVVNVNTGANTFEVALTPGGASLATTSPGSGLKFAVYFTPLPGWTDNDESGASSILGPLGYMNFTGNGTSAAIRDQTVTVAAADQGVEHALRIVVTRGPIVLRVGTSTTDDSYISETTLDTGEHSLAFTPTGDFNIRFLNRLKRKVILDSCTIEAAGEMRIATAYTASYLDKIVADPYISQSGDIIFVACEGLQQTKIERRGTRSWSLAKYYANDGPFRIPNTGPITLTPAALSGNTTLTASAALFKATQVGALFRVTSSGQTVTASITAQNTFTNAIEVSGVDAQRIFTLTITGLSATGSTTTLQRSLVSGDGPWTDYASYTTDQSTTIDDGLDNQTLWYRIGVKTGGYAAGTIVPTLTYQAGSIDGICRVTAFTSSTVVDVEVIVDFGGTAATDDWAEGEWSDYRGWPTAGAFNEGRLTWSGKNGHWQSVSDAFTSFDANVEGDSGTIARTIGAGPVDVINWVLPLQRLILGAQGAEFSARASSFDEILTPTNFNIKPASTQGSARVQAVKIDSRGVYVQRGGTRVFELAFENEGYDYASTELSILIPEIGQPRIVRMAVQRQPDTRVHFVRSDGTVAVLIYNKAENLTCWLELETDGEVEDVSVLPGAVGSEEDQVYYVVKRTINGSTVRYHEKWAKDSECVGGTLNKQADAFVTFTNATPLPVATGLTHLIGESVVVWQDGTCPENASGDPKTYTVSGAGEITLDTAATTGVVGLAYRARWMSSKLTQLQAQLGTPLTQHKKLVALGLILANTHHKGLKYGQDFDHLRSLPATEGGKPVAAGTIYAQYDEPNFAVNGSWNTDARLCLQADAPRPATVLAAVPMVDMT